MGSEFLFPPRPGTQVPPILCLSHKEERRARWDLSSQHGPRTGLRFEAEKERGPEMGQQSLRADPLVL